MCFLGTVLVPEGVTSISLCSLGGCISVEEITCPYFKIPRYYMTQTRAMIWVWEKRTMVMFWSGLARLRRNENGDDWIM